MLDTGQLPLNGEALAWFQKGLAAASEQNYKVAVTRFNRVLQLRPDYYEVWYERGLALERWGYYQEAIVSFDRALHLEPPRMAMRDLWHERGNALQYGLGHYERSLECYDRALAITPEHEWVWLNRGNALLYGLDRPEGALLCYDHALAVNSRNALAWRNRGHALVEMGRQSDAIACYERAIALNPEDDIACHSRNQLVDQLGLRPSTTTTQHAHTQSMFDESTIIENARIQEHLTTEEIIPQFDPSDRRLVVIIEDDQGAREIELTENQYVVGREPKNNLRVYSKFVSRYHAVLTQSMQANGLITYEITDGDLDGKLSTNGLLVNGQKYHHWELQSGDIVVLGPRVRLRYQVKWRSDASGGEGNN